MTDLTKITTPYGLLDAETQEALRNCGGPWEFYMGDEKAEWTGLEGPSFYEEYAYRQAPQPVTYPRIPWEHVDEKWQFWARDKSGLSYFFVSTPEIKGSEWLNSGDIKSLGVLKLDPGTCDWRDSLMERPK